MTQYLLETIITTVPHHSIWETQEQALCFVGTKLAWWVREKRCSAEAAKEITALLEQHRYTEAMDAWNNATKKPSIALCEIEILTRDCHHDPGSTIVGKDVYFAVESVLDGISQHDLLDSSFAALESVAFTLKQWTGKNPLFAQECNELIRQRVRRLLRKNEIAKAIDVWMAAKPNPTIAVHKLRILRKGCRHDVA